jgi:DNA repair exonuclease SbcCD ATPase subunit
VKINNLHISSFGKLQDMNRSFDSGMNIYLGDNEHGKSTMLSFIRAMFYGFSQRGSTGIRMKDNDRRKFIPWNGSSVGGSIEFEHEGKKYLLEKSFVKRKSDDTATLTLLPSGRKIDVGQREVGDYLFGISESEFVNTVFVGQLSSNILHTDKETDDVSARLSNLAGTGTELFSHEEIKNRLTSASAKLQALRGQGGLIPRLEEEWNRLTEQEAQLEDCELRSDLLYREIVSGKEQEEDLQKERKLLAERLKTQKLKIEQIQSKIKEFEIKEKAELTRISMEREKNAATELLAKTNQEYLQQRESLRKQLNEERIKIEEEIDRLYKEKKEDLIRSEELSNGLLSMIQNQDSASRIAKAFLDKHTEETSELEKEVLAISSDIKPLLQTRSDIMKGRTQFFGKTYSARLVIAMLLLVFAVTTVFYILIRNPMQLIGVAFLLGAAAIFAVNRLQLRRVNLKIVSLNSLYAAKMALFEASSASYFDAQDVWKEAMARLEELYLQQKKYEEDTEKDSQRREYFIKQTIERRKTCVDRLEQLGDSPDVRVEQPNASVANVPENVRPTDLQETRSTDDPRPDASLRELHELLEQTRKTYAQDAELEERIQSEIGICRVDIARKETNRENMIAQSPDRSLILEQKETISERLESARTYYRSLQTAQRVLDEAFSEMENVFAPQVNERAGTYLSQLTGGVYSKLHVDRSFSVEMASEGDYSYHPIDYFSGGTVDQVYLALRLAISDLVQTSDDKMPLLLDDAFMQYDDVRAGLGLNMLRELSRSRQIILFTCHKRMKDMYEERT